ncbi:MAG: hypothetical protein P4L53_20600 [Candidatus Obscuribacterales bacterium]|nr:hypothetical protein [Candidatus Obscuribacterales bacterium]
MAKTITQKPNALQLPENWILSGGNHRRYEAGIDASVQHDGKQALLLKNRDGITKTYGWTSLQASTEAEKYRGKRLRLTMWVKTDDVSWVMPWMNVQTETDMVSYDNSCDRRLSGTTEWQKWSIVLDVPTAATAVEYGVMLGGNGKVWISQSELSVVADDIDTTDCPCLSDRKKKSSKAAASRKKIVVPKGWTHRLVYRSKADYGIGIDQDNSFNGKAAAYINIKKAATWESVELYQFMNCDGYRGKRIRFTVQLKSLDVKCGVFFVDVMGSHEGTVALDNMENRKLQGTHDWVLASVVLDVPENAVQMNFGARVTGGGTMWFSDLRFEEVDETVAVTDDYSTGCRGIWWSNLINADFSENEEERYLNQSSKPGIVAKGWLGWSEPDGAFEVGIDSVNRRDGKNSGCVKGIVPGSRFHTAGLFQKFDAKIYRRKRVRLTAFVKTEGKSEQSGLVLSVMDARQSNLFSQNTFDIDSNTEHDWVKREIVVDVPPHAGVFMISLDVTGDGSAWINEPALEVVDTDVPVTISTWKARLLNLEFSE